MIKRFVLIAVFLLTSCGKQMVALDPFDASCPQVQIIRNDAYLTQYVKYKEAFQINLSGYEGYCHYEEGVGRYKAVIRPIFTIKRLRPSDETDVRFSYYTETVKGPPEYLGKKTYFANAKIGLNDREVIYKGSTASVYIPSVIADDYDVNLGLWISPEEKLYNQRTFDINYRYYDKE